MSILRFIKNWTLPLSMGTGIAAYLIYYSIPSLHFMGPALAETVAWLQPTLIFLMLFLQFNKVAPADMRLRRWHFRLVLVQCILFTLTAVAAYCIKDESLKVVVECAMLCLICPTATAAGVVTDKLGGSISGIMTYIVVINCAVSLIVPALLPMLSPSSDISFLYCSWLIIKKIFPVLIMPCAVAWFIRYTMPKVQKFFLKYADMAFYLWSAGLIIALSVTTRGIILSGMSFLHGLFIGTVVMLCCAFQFWFGRRLARRWGRNDCVTAGQALGQKNTLFQIWLGNTFLTPETALSGGFYSLFHNLVNSWELYRARKAAEKKS